ncbi:MAG: integrase/recombinase [Gammaproteobacteria bacterium]|nr:integrase/recombinase [Gammaproteobacteria bacterium]
MSIKQVLQVVDKSHTVHGKGARKKALAPHIDGFSGYLSGEGYASQTVSSKCAWIADIDRWLRRRRLSLRQLDEEQVKRFHLHRRALRRRGDLTTGQQLLEYLREAGCIPKLRRKIDRTPFGKITREYARFLSSERGLSANTITGYVQIVRRFLTERFEDEPLRFRHLRLRDLHRFILRDTQRGSRSRARLAVTALRSFLRFLQLRGQIKTDLAAAICGVAHWRMSNIPKSLPPEQVEKLLRSCDRNTPSGQRDYAILLLLARLGLRGGEVLAMSLDDVDWDHGEIVVHGRRRRLDRLPLPKDVGAALVQYLKHVRPVCTTRRIFIRLKAPWRGLRQSAICCVIRRALKRAGLNPDFTGAHLMRHSLATGMLRRGASLREIGQLLRHVQPTTTQIYAKVDITALRRIALPWMGEGR